MLKKRIFIAALVISSVFIFAGIGFATPKSDFIKSFGGHYYKKADKNGTDIMSISKYSYAAGTYGGYFVGYDIDGVRKISGNKYVISSKTTFEEGREDSIKLKKPYKMTFYKKGKYVSLINAEGKLILKFKFITKNTDVFRKYMDKVNASKGGVG